MALLNRFFSSRKKPFSRAQDNVSEKLFTFTNEQVRVVVFRECDFRGRKLLFDSRTVQKVALENAAGDESESQRTAGTKKYVEVGNGYGYTYTKPNTDVARLGEMIFGSVAMSFRGTTYKVHSLPIPSRLVCSQVFPSPKNPLRQRSSAPSHTHHGIEQSIRLEDSGASSATSGSDQSVLSGASDTVLVCKRQQSVPLDVPVNFSLVSSSGYGEEHSYSSISSGPQSIPVDLSQGMHSGDSLSRRWPGSSSLSLLDPSSGSLPCSISTDESFPKVRSSKIGLAVLIELTDGEEEKLEQFLMEHAAVVEMMMWRVRRSVEGAYIRHGTFVSVMYDISGQTAHWLVDLLAGTRPVANAWHSHFQNCDNLFSIIKNSHSISFLGHLTDGSPSNRFPAEGDGRHSVRFSALASGVGLFSNFKSDSSPDICESSGEFSFVNLSRFLRNEHAVGVKRTESVLMAEKFIKEFCELLESIDAKHTNFFISTLITAVLTHHLGWVSTALPVTLKPNKAAPRNPFWSQFTDLYGAIGHPVKMSRTIVSGSNKSELVPKILNALTYFIRCSDISRRCRRRADVDWENERAEEICRENSCIPKENYKKYEDHLREIELEQSEILMKFDPLKAEPARKFCLTKTHTCLTDLCKLNGDQTDQSSSKLSKTRQSTCLSDFSEQTCISGLKIGLSEAQSSPLENLSETNQPSSLSELSELQNSNFSDKQQLSFLSGLIDKRQPSCLLDLRETQSSGVANLSRTHQPCCLSDLGKLSETQTHVRPAFNTLSKPLQDLNKSCDACLFDLSKLSKSSCPMDSTCESNNSDERTAGHSEILDRITHMGLQVMNSSSKIDVTCSFLQNVNPHQQQLIDISEAKQQIERVFSPKKKFVEGAENMEAAHDTLFNPLEIITNNTQTDGSLKFIETIKTDKKFMQKTTDDNLLNATKKVVFCKSGESVEAENEAVERTMLVSQADTSTETISMHEFTSLQKNNSKTFKLHKSPKKSELTAADTSYDCVDGKPTETRNLSAFADFSPKSIYDSEEIDSLGSVEVHSYGDGNNNYNSDNNVVFVLGENERLIGIKRETTPTKRPTQLSIKPGKNVFYSDSDSSPGEPIGKSPNFRDYIIDTSPFKEADFSRYDDATGLKPSTSFTETDGCSSKPPRALSEPPELPKPDPVGPCTSTKYKYSGVKFNFQQYPQIVENYMKNKNIELSNMQFSEKKLDFRWQSGTTTFDYSRRDDGDDQTFDEGEPLTTPSNASELEFTSELVIDKPDPRKAAEAVEVPRKRLEFTRNTVPNAVVKELNPFEHAKFTKDARNRKLSEERIGSNLKIVELPMPRSSEIKSNFPSIDYKNSLIRGYDDHYVSDMVLQGTSAPKCEWESLLKKDLVLSTQHSFSNQQVEESIAIVANTDTWEVQLMSSHTYVIDRGATGVPVGMSQLVANMLETLLHMWRLHTPAEYCLMHIEQQLQEFCVRSKALAQLLLDTDFCSMEILTSTLRLEVNDVPLLMAIASTHTPQVTQKYGLSFQ